MPSQLRRVSTTSGFLEACPIDFGPGLTCIIGARGTCKSTLIESIRFAFDNSPAYSATVSKEPEGDQTASTYGIMRETLRAGSVRCELVEVGSIGEAAYSLEREIGAATRLFVDGVREHARRDVLDRIEVFSQGDLQRIAEDESYEMRLALVDRPNRTKVEELKAARLDAATRLSALGHQIRTARARVATLTHEAAQLEAFQTQLHRTKAEAPLATPELESERQRYERRQRLLDAMKQVVKERDEVVRALKDSLPAAKAFIQRVAVLEAESEEDLGGTFEVLHPLVQEMKQLGETLDHIEGSDLETAIKHLEQLLESRSERFYRLRQEQQAVNESLKQQAALQRQVDHLLEQARAAEIARQIEKDLLGKRNDLRAEISKIDDALYDLRVAEIDAINREHHNTVQLTLGSTSSTKEYANRLNGLLSGSRIRTQEEVAAAIAQRIDPPRLIDIVEGGQAQHLAESLNRDLGQMTRVVAHLADHPDLYALETELPAARLEITLYDNGHPKPVETLSKGQRATALLPLILRPLPYPLLFDQPEDDLDNRFIFESLIRTLRKLKEQRQVIFVTHNANIPVLGGADAVIVMRMGSPTRALPALVGTVDERKTEILNLLEGGAEAFLQRERYYHDLLPDDDGGQLV